jgi:hypothetical protein
MMKNKDISYEHNRWSKSGYTAHKEIIQAATLKLNDVTILYCSKKKFDSFSCEFRIELNIMFASRKMKVTYK